MPATHQRSPRRCLCSLLLALVLAGCKDSPPAEDAGVPDLERPADRAVSREQASGPDSAVKDRLARIDKTPVDQNLTPHLSATHGGWKQALCFDCHKAGSVDGGAAYPHPTSSYKPTDCVGCHGFNGAQHRDHAVKTSNCKTCHMTATHIDKFGVPLECVVCHNHPDNPGGF